MAHPLVTLNVGDIAPNPHNTRRIIDQARLQELADSIKNVGVLEPIIVRPMKAGKHELVVGERRWRAAQLAGLVTLDAQVRTLTDLQVAEIMLIENRHRADVHPLEEADGFARLQVLDRSYSVKAIAAKIGMSERYVQSRLHYTVLVEDVRKAFFTNRITAGHAELIARLKPADQARALKHCFDSLYGDDEENGVIAVRALDRWIKNEIRLELPAAGTEQPLLETLVPELAPHVAKGIDLSKVVQVRGYGTEASKGLAGPDTYKRIDPKVRCIHATTALMMIGGDRGKVFDVCMAKTECTIHWGVEIERNKKPTGTSQKNGTITKKVALDPTPVYREEAIQAARTQLGKATLKPGPALLALLLETTFSWGLPKKTWGGVAARGMEDLFVNNDDDWKTAVKLLKPLGIDLSAHVAKLAAKDAPKTPPVKKPAPAKSKATKTPAKKPTTKTPKRAGGKKAGAKK